MIHLLINSKTNTPIGTDSKLIMSPLKRKILGKDEASEVKKSRNDTVEDDEQEMLEHNQLIDLVTRTILSILGEARGPMSRSEIKELVVDKLQGLRIRDLGHLA